MSKLEMELYSAKQMARQYKTLYEKERAVKKRSCDPERYRQNKAVTDPRFHR